MAAAACPARRPVLSLALSLLCLAPLSACVAVGEVAYDMRLKDEEARCRSQQPLNEQSACLQRVRQSERQAEQVRKLHEDRDKAPAKDPRAADLCFTRSNGERVCPN